MSKFGPAFKGELKHYVVLGKRIREALHESIRLFFMVREKSKAQELIASLGGVVQETHFVAMRCLQRGEITSAIHMTRLVQEAASKMMASFLRPDLIDEGQMSLKQVGREMRKAGFPNWGPYHGLMSSISHVNDGYLLGGYEHMRVDSPVTKMSMLLVEEFLVNLNVLGVSALSVLHINLKDRMGSDFKSLMTKYDKLEAEALRDRDVMLGRQTGLSTH